MGEDLADAKRKLAWLRELLREQQQRIHRQRELVARLENETTNRALLRSARESLRQMIKSHEAILSDAAVAQERNDVRLSMNSTK